MEMLYPVQRAGWRVGEVPIVFHNCQQGVSKISRNEVYKAPTPSCACSGVASLRHSAVNTASDRRSG